MRARDKIRQFVQSGIMNPDGSDAGRVGAILSAVLVEGPQGWAIAAAQFTAEA